MSTIEMPKIILSYEDYLDELLKSGIASLTFKGHTGYSLARGMYEEKLRITKDSASYEYVPTGDTPALCHRSHEKWRYHSNSEKVAKNYQKLCDLAKAYLKAGSRCDVYDADEMTLVIRFENKRTLTLCISSYYSEYEQFIKLLRSYIPKFENTPEIF